MGDHAAALPLYRQALEIRRTALGENHPDFATSLNNLAMLYLDDGGPRRRSTPLPPGAGDPPHRAGREPPGLRHQPEQPGGVVPAMGDHAAALPLYRQAWRSAAPRWARTTPTTPPDLNNLALFYAATGRASEALPLMEQAAAIDDRMIGQIFAIGSERQRIAFLSNVS